VPPTLGPPTWLSYATPAVALVALLVAVASLAVALRTYRRAGPRVGAKTAWFGSERAADDCPAEIAVEFWNSGLEAVSIEDFRLRFASNEGTYDQRFEYDPSAGSELPTEIAPGRRKSAAVTVRRIYVPDNLQRQFGGLPAVTSRNDIAALLKRARLVVRLGNRQALSVKLRFATSPRTFAGLHLPPRD
jgi:hypothetical protein